MPRVFIEHGQLETHLPAHAGSAVNDDHRRRRVALA